MRGGLLGTKLITLCEMNQKVNQSVSLRAAGWLLRQHGSVTFLSLAAPSSSISQLICHFGRLRFLPLSLFLLFSCWLTQEVLLHARNYRLLPVWILAIASSVFWKQKWPCLEKRVTLRLNLVMPDKLAANTSDSWLAWLARCICHSHMWPLWYQNADFGWWKAGLKHNVLTGSRLLGVSFSSTSAEQDMTARRRNDLSITR